MGIVTLRSLPDSAVVVDAVTAEIEAMAQHEWYELGGAGNAAVENPKLEDVAYDGPIEITGSIASIAGAWSGGCYDSLRRRMLVWGGGHNSYAGNEIYAYRLTAPYGWLRVSDPSPGPFGDAVQSDGSPGARHTYDSLDYLPTIDRMFVGHGNGLFNGGTTDQSWLWDPDDPDVFEQGTPKGWAQTQGVVPDGAAGTAIMAVHGGKVYHLASGTSSNWVLGIYDIATDTWSVTDGQQSQGFLNSNGFTAIVVPASAMASGVDTFVFCGWGTDQRIFTIPLDATNLSESPIEVMKVPSGSEADLDAWFDPSTRQGIDYRPNDGKVYGWVQGSNAVAEIDFSTSTPSLVMRSAASGPGDLADTTAGTYGRWRYIPHLDRFCLVHTTNQRVWLWRP